jgi:hypothetical protein
MLRAGFAHAFLGAGQKFRAAGVDRKHWSGAGPIRQIFKDAFARAGLHDANPHVFRRTLAQLGQRLCQTPEAFKAWSQNLGHEGVLTTFTSYGEVSSATEIPEEVRRFLRRAPGEAGD